VLVFPNPATSSNGSEHRYDPNVSKTFARDTSVEISEELVARWRSMSPVEKAELVEVMCREADDLARMGIAFRYGPVSPERERYLMAERRYGTDFADRYFGESSPLPVRPVSV
jgi:hypothetical protein